MMACTPLNNFASCSGTAVVMSATEIAPLGTALSEARASALCMQSVFFIFSRVFVSDRTLCIKETVTGQSLALEERTSARISKASG